MRTLEYARSSVNHCSRPHGAHSSSALHLLIHLFLTTILRAGDHGYPAHGREIQRRGVGPPARRGWKGAQSQAWARRRYTAPAKGSAFHFWTLSRATQPHLQATAAARLRLHVFQCPRSSGEEAAGSTREDAHSVTRWRRTDAGRGHSLDPTRPAGLPAAPRTPRCAPRRAGAGTRRGEAGLPLPSPEMASVITTTLFCTADLDHNLDTSW